MMTTRHQKSALASVAAALLVCVPLASGTFSGDHGKVVETARVDTRLLRPSVLASGQITHEEEVRLTSEVLGAIEIVHVREGQHVKRGELVLVIDSEAYAADVAEGRAAVRIQKIDIGRVRARIANLARQHERSTLLFKQGVLDAHSLEASRHELELARIDLRSSRERLEQARARLGQAEDRLDKTRVRAPIDGVVTALDVDAGETAIPSSTNIPGSQLMTIADPERIIAEVHVDEADVAAVRVGQAAEIVAVAHPGQPMTGRIAFIANTATTQPPRRSLSFVTKIRVTPAESMRLRPGMSCRAEILTHDGKVALAVPIEAIVTGGTGGTVEGDSAGKAVFVVRGGSAHLSPVVTGQSDDAHQHVLSGLTEGDRVVRGPGRTLRSLRDGDAVRLHSGDRDPVAVPSGGQREN